MTEINKKLKEIVEQYKIHESKLLFIEDIKQEEIDNWFIEIKKDLINYIHCSLQLKDKETITFLDWRIANKWSKWYDTGLYKKDKTYKTREELRKLYISEQTL